MKRQEAMMSDDVCDSASRGVDDEVGTSQADEFGSWYFTSNWSNSNRSKTADFSFEVTSLQRISEALEDSSHQWLMTHAV